MTIPFDFSQNILSLGMILGAASDTVTIDGFGNLISGETGFLGNFDPGFEANVDYINTEFACELSLSSSFQHPVPSSTVVTFTGAGLNDLSVVGGIWSGVEDQNIKIQINQTGGENDILDDAMGSYTSNMSNPANIYDDELSTYATAGTNDYFKWKANSSVLITKYTMTEVDGANLNNYVQSLKLEGSFDDSNWITLDTQSGLTNTNTKQTFNISVANQDYYLYYKLTISSTYGATTYIGEIEFITESDKCFYYINGSSSPAGYIFLANTGRGVVLNNGVLITTSVNTGHTVGDYWEFTVTNPKSNYNWEIKDSEIGWTTLVSGEVDFNCAAPTTDVLISDDYLFLSGTAPVNKTPIKTRLTLQSSYISGEINVTIPSTSSVKMRAIGEIL